jgi:hypothetical protein
LEIREVISDFEIAADGTRLALKKSFRKITYVHGTLHKPSRAITFASLDKRLEGPKIAAYDPSENLVEATADIIVGGV